MVNRRRRSKKWIWWLIILVLLILAGVICYLVWDNYFNDKKNEKKEVETTTEMEQIESIEKEEPVADENNDEDDKKVKQYEGEDPNTQNELSGVITYAGVIEGVLMVRVNIDQFLDSGECTLTLEQGGAIIYSSIAKIAGNASTATCGGFDIPVSQLGGGNTIININLNADNKTGVIRGEVNI